MIKGIISDLGGVYFSNGLRAFMAELNQKYRTPNDSLRQTLTGESPLGRSYRTNEISVNEFWHKAKALLGIHEDYHKLIQQWNEKYTPNKEVVALIGRLRKAGFQLGFLSNNVIEKADYLEKKFQFKKDFDTGVFSFEVKCMKPDLEICREILKKMSLQPSEAIYFDDKEKFLEPAKKLGMNVILYEDPGQLELSLTSFGLTF
jgi:putative hydrolase of the HAD superfamily